MHLPPAIIDRALCPCCGYPTLAARNAFEICELCNWEDDGQDELDAEAVLGGPNGDYSLAAARKNFFAYGVMYAPGNDLRLTGPDSAAATALKRDLSGTFDQLKANRASAELVLEVLRLEEALSYEVQRQLDEVLGEEQPAT